MTAPPGAQWEADADLVVVGSGAAGLAAAARALDLGLRTLVVTKAAIDDGCTRWAQGGIAVVCDGPDSVDDHVADTVAAGAGLCDIDSVRMIVDRGRAEVRRLRWTGAAFDRGRSATELARTREGGHRACRVIHAGGDATGAEVERALVENARAHELPVLERHIAVDALLTPARAVGGLLVLDENDIPGELRAPAIVLATGGLGQLYSATTNPVQATADGIAVGLRAGALVRDIEFVQFHPTVLYAPGMRGRRPLITEAVRGEGAVILDASGDPVMTGKHPLGDLAPRDVVAKAITKTMATTPGRIGDHVFLDATRIPAFATRFPTVQAICLAAGVDPQSDPIPIAPAAHFACGGVATDRSARTSVSGLYAVGEVARTGMHGANRLASNSLLESLVMGAVAAESVASDSSGQSHPMPELTAPSAGIAQGAHRESLQALMTAYAGIGRDAGGLATAAAAIASSGARPLTNRTAVEDAALTLTARAVLTAAACRPESRGCHVRSDRPDRDDIHCARSQSVRLDDSGAPVVESVLERVR